MGLIVLAILGVATHSRDTKPASATSATVTKTATTSTQADYDAGYARGTTEGADHARSGAGMPIPLGMNAMANSFADGAHPADAEAWKTGFEAGFEAGYESVTSFSRDESQWTQLSWANARRGVKLYDYGGKHVATIQNADADSGLIVVRYRSGEVEPKSLNAVAPYWWVRRE